MRRSDLLGDDYAEFVEGLTCEAHEVAMPLRPGQVRRVIDGVFLKQAIQHSVVPRTGPVSLSLDVLSQPPTPAAALTMKDQCVEEVERYCLDVIRVTHSSVASERG